MTETVSTLLQQAHWHEERKKLRAILLDCGLEEAVKWNALTYARKGANVAIIYGMADSCAVGFFKGSLLSDVAGNLVSPGKHSQAMRRLHFHSLADIEASEGLIRSTIAEAIELEEQGRKVVFDASSDPDKPAELTDAFGRDPGFKAAFEALTPGRQRGYLLHFADASKSETRARRIEIRRADIMRGKGMHDR